MNLDEKECPYCAEIIKAKAIKCKHCSANLSAVKTSNMFAQSKSLSDFHKKNNRWSIFRLIVIGLVALAFVYTNPTKSVFFRSILKKVETSETGNQSNIISEVVAELSDGLSSATKTNNYLLFTIFEIESPITESAKPNARKLKFLGVGGHIFSLFNEQPTDEENKLIAKKIPNKIKKSLESHYSNLSDNDYIVEKTLDFNGDKIKDYVISINSDDYCGSLGCQTIIYISEGSNFKPAFGDSVRTFEDSIEKIGGLPVLTMHVSGIACDSFNMADCIAKVYWQGAKLKVKYHLKSE